jgi:hypothetical protein
MIGAPVVEKSPGAVQIEATQRLSFRAPDKTIRGQAVRGICLKINAKQNPQPSASESQIIVKHVAG